MVIKPSVCIDAVFERQSIESAIRSVAKAGIPAFDFWGWWDKDLEAIQKSQTQHGHDISACCTRFISLVDPALRDDYIQGLTASIEAAHRLGVKTLISQVGNFRNNASREEQHRCLLEGLIEAAPLLEKTDLTLVIEPLNELVDHQGYYMVRSDKSLPLI